MSAPFLLRKPPEEEQGKGERNRGRQNKRQRLCLLDACKTTEVGKQQDRGDEQKAAAERRKKRCTQPVSGALHKHLGNHAWRQKQVSKSLKP